MGGGRRNERGGFQKLIALGRQRRVVVAPPQKIMHFSLETACVGVF